MVIRVAVVSEDEIYLKRLMDGLDKYLQLFRQN
jgi:hypothetical protein